MYEKTNFAKADAGLLRNKVQNKILFSLKTWDVVVL